MDKVIHVHIHGRRQGKTADGGFEESKHPRKDDGKFGQGSGGAKGKSSPARREDLKNDEQGSAAWHEQKAKEFEELAKSDVPGSTRAKFRLQQAAHHRAEAEKLKSTKDGEPCGCGGT